MPVVVNHKFSFVLRRVPGHSDDEAGLCRTWCASGKVDWESKLPVLPEVVLLGKMSDEERQIFGASFWDSEMKSLRNHTFNSSIRYLPVIVHEVGQNRINADIRDQGRWGGGGQEKGVKGEI